MKFNWFNNEILKKLGVLNNDENKSDWYFVEIFLYDILIECMKI